MRCLPALTKMYPETRKHHGKTAHPALILKVARNLEDRWCWEAINQQIASYKILNHPFHL